LLFILFAEETSARFSCLQLARKITWIGIGWRLGRGAPQLLAADPNGPEPKKLEGQPSASAFFTEGARSSPTDFSSLS